MKIKFSAILVFFSLILSSLSLMSQTTIDGLSQKVQYVDLIVSGEVIRKEAFLHKDGRIYTQNFISPRLLLKGEIHDLEDFVVLSRGGEVDGKIESWTHQEKFNVGDNGIFFFKRHLLSI